MFESGHGVKIDYQKARKWYQKAADLGSTNAMRFLAVLYRDGLGVQKDNKKFTELSQRAENSAVPPFLI
jgi:TPR repeat protein